MKKSLLGGLVALAFAASANATVVPVGQSVTSADLPASVAFGFAIGAASPFYIEFTSAGILTVQNTFVGNLPTSGLTVTWELFLDNNAAVGAADIGASSLALATLNPGQAATFSYSAGVNYVMKFTSASPVALLQMQAVPVPAAAWLFGSALFGAGALRRKQKAELAA